MGTRRGRLPEWLRTLLLFLSFSGMLASVFWDSFLLHSAAVKRYIMSSSPSSHSTSSSAQGGECPMMKLGGAGDTAVDLGKILNLDELETERDSVSAFVDDKTEMDSVEWLTEQELSFYDGSKPSGPVLVSVDGVVFNVSENKEQYAAKEGSSYGAFGGKAITRALVLSSLDAKDMNDNLEDVPAENLALKPKWLAFFRRKYPVVARLAASEQVLQTGHSAHCSAQEELTQEQVNKLPGVFAVTSDMVLNLTRAEWLYGDMGVRFRLPPPIKTARLYPCIGKLAQDGEKENR